MEPNKILKIGLKYSKTDLSVLLDQPSLTSVREGVAEDVIGDWEIISTEQKLVIANFEKC